MRHLLESWNEVGRRLAGAETVALFLDFDGTLAPLRARPEEVRLHPATKRILYRLACRPRLRVWVVSGRLLADVRGRVGIPHLRYLGLHGWEGGPSRELSDSTKAALRDARRDLSARLGRTFGVWIEEKGATFAVHYRAAGPASTKKARTALRRTIEPYGARLRVIKGDRVWEVLPREVGGKGVAAHREWRTFRSALPVYVGNDGTDESAFIALSDGVTVRVGPKQSTHARFRLSGPAEVRRFLEKLEAELR